MKCELTELEPCKYNIVFEPSITTILDKRGEVIEAFKKAPVPGNRVGKASVDVIKHHYKDQIEDSVKRALAEHSFHQAIFEKDLKPYGPPNFKSVSLLGNSFSCEFELLTKPKFNLEEYKNLEIPKPYNPDTESMLVEKLLQELRVKYGESIPFTETDKVEKNDDVIINYESFIDGVRQEALSAVGELVRVGSNAFSAVDDQLLGMKIGDKKEFKFVAPESGMPSLKGQLIDFHVELVMGSRNQPLPLNDELAKALGKSTMEELRAWARELATAKLSTTNKQLLNTAVSTKLVEMHNIDVPNFMKLSEAQYLASSAKLNWDSMQDLDKEAYLELGEKNVKLALILDAIRSTEPESQLSDGEIFNIIKENLLAKDPKLNVENAIKELQGNGFLGVLIARLRDEYALDFIVKHAQILE